jgi:hypothetical protein
MTIGLAESQLLVARAELQLGIALQRAIHEGRPWQATTLDQVFAQRGRSLAQIERLETIIRQLKA